MNADCLAEATVLAFLGGTLPPNQRSAAEAHIAACNACSDLVTWAAADQGNSTMRLPGHEGRPFVGQLHPGARVGRYQILGALGRGGMGEVYAAYHPDLDRRIALKVVQGFDSSTGEQRMRLLREARAIARLSHPNVVMVHDAGTFGDRVFIAMELIDGLTIDRWLRSEPRTWQQIVDVFIAAGRGLAAAHARGVIHRDFKPQNVMIANDGAVRVMDFGLARLDEQEADEQREADDDPSTVSLGPATRTGALVGTPAYMSPEQFRREKIDARADQFSFCVALHEALFGRRPPGATADEGERAEKSPPLPTSRAGVPGWLRAIVVRGAAPEREQRYPSMLAMIAALERGRTRPRRRVLLVAVVAATLLAGAGSWRIARGSHFACAVPEGHVAAAWSSNPADARRQSIHRSFAASGRATAETSWERLSRVLDRYVTAWSTMYLETCEATHIRGEQSAEVLDLRMSCLNDDLDQVGALTDKLAAADSTALSHAVTAALDMTPVSRCADVALLRSAVPLPRDEKVLRDVQRLRPALAEVQTLLDIGDFAGVLKRSNALRSEVEATGYKPLLADLLNFLGIAEAGIDEDPTQSEATLRAALLVAEAARDDLTAAKIVAELVYVVGYRLGRLKEAEFWAALGQTILDRVGGDQARLRSWIDGHLAGACARVGDFERGRVLSERSVQLKERSLGADHPEVATSLGDLTYMLVHAGRPTEALSVANRSIEIFLKHGDPEGLNLGLTYSNQGEALNALGKYAEAETAFQNALQILSKNLAPTHPEYGYEFQGLGETKLAQGAPNEAVGFFKDALRVREQPHADAVLAAESRFGLARALWEGRGDRSNARTLATAALKTFRDERRKHLQRSVEMWLADHRV